MRPANIYQQRLFFPFLYGRNTLDALNQQYAGFLIERSLLPALTHADSSITKSLLVSIIASLKVSHVNDTLQNNLPLLSAITGLNSTQLEIMLQYGKVDEVAHLNTKSVASEFFKDTNSLQTAYRSLFSTRFFNQFVDQSHLHSTNKQLLDFIGQSIVVNQEICLLQKVLPGVLTATNIVLDNQVRSFMSEVEGTLPKQRFYCNQDSFLLELQNLIPQREY
ncbi:hypothetical protein [Facilibium subflavum]|uniref:hypothetical protein n=1 Tax=Facilibium subflavum TaxID=2219058 RepID=UPI000E65B4C6|nr:hypothetical protein [Facilibium subflavum]